MNVVLYTHELEPITVIDLPQHWIDVGLQRRLVFLAVWPQGMPRLVRADEPLSEVEFKTVAIEFEELRMRNVRSCILLTHDDVNALQLEPGWLPGQCGEINRMRSENRKLAEALVNALQRRD